VYPAATRPSAEHPSRLNVHQIGSRPEDGPDAAYLMHTAAAILAAYLLGAIPTAYVRGRKLRGVDIRMLGGRNVGLRERLQTPWTWSLRA